MSGEVERRQVVGARQAIIQERAGAQLAALAVVNRAFVERLADALDQAAMHLARHDERIDVVDKGKKIAAHLLEAAEIVHGDTAKIPFGMGTYASRSLAVGGSALVKALDKDMALAAADYAGFERRRQELARAGKLRGIGIATYIEACAMAPPVIAGQLGARAGFYEAAAVRVHPTASVTVFTGAHSHGQGHETTFAQLVADRLGLAIEQGRRGRNRSRYRGGNAAEFHRRRRFRAHRGS